MGMNLDDVTQANPHESLSDRDSPLGRYYRWLLCDPTHKDYWTARATDRETATGSTDKEES